MEVRYKISIAETEEDKSRAYELRKRVFGDELNDCRFIVEGKYFIDPYDKKEAIILIAENEFGEIIGTFRNYPRSAGEYIYDYLYFSDKLIDHTKMSKEFLLQNSIILSRGCVEKMYRQHGLYGEMIDALIAYTLPSQVAIACIETWNIHSLSPFLKRGFTIYQTGETRPGYEYNWVVKQL
jgi:hypothetical protein